MALTGLPAQDYVEIGTMRTPGICRIPSVGAPRKWEIRAGYGQSNGTVIFQGNELSKFSIYLDLWEDSHFVAFGLLYAAFLARAKLPTPVAGPFLPSITPKAVGLKHPILAAQGISEVVIEDVIMGDADEYMKATYEIKCIQWGKPAPALGKPLAAIPAAAAPTPTARDAADLAIAAKLTELKGLMGQ